jgi:tRNA 2-thiouridine synthesizing protein A
MADAPDPAPPGGAPGAAEEIDARGLLCPLPVLRLRKRLERLAPGAVVAIAADDPAARVDVPHFCAEQGHALLAEEEAADGTGTLRFLVRKGG